MNAKLAAAGGVVAVVLLVVVVGLTLTGFPLFGGGEGEPTGDFPTATPVTDGGGGGSDGAAGGGVGDAGGSGNAGGSGDSESTPSGPPFTFAIEEIEECGQTCRDVTSRLTNNQDRTATNVEVHVRIFAGNGTDEGDVIWRGNDTAGTLEAGQSYTTTRRVELSLGEGLAVQRNDGWITIQTTVVTDRRTVTFTGNRDVL